MKIVFPLPKRYYERYFIYHNEKGEVLPCRPAIGLAVLFHNERNFEMTEDKKNIPNAGMNAGDFIH